MAEPKLVASLNKEYPEGLSPAEMTLVRMISRGRRSWADKMEIINAINNLQWDASNMRKEREHLFPEEDKGVGSASRPSDGVAE